MLNANHCRRDLNVQDPAQVATTAEQRRRFLRSHLLCDILLRHGGPSLTLPAFAEMARQSVDVDGAEGRGKVKLFNLDSHADSSDINRNSESVQQLYRSLSSELDDSIERLSLINSSNVHSPSLLKQLNALDERRSKIRNLEFNFIPLIRGYGQIILSSIGMLGELVGRLKLSVETERTSVFQQYFASIIGNMKLKLDLLKCETLLSLYSPEVLSSLQELKLAIKSDNSALSDRATKLDRKLSSFAHLCKCSADFAFIVTEYEKTLSSISSAEHDLKLLVNHHQQPQQQ